MRKVGVKGTINRAAKLVELAFLVIVLLAVVSGAVSASVVTFPDRGLEAAIREAIGKPTGDIYDRDVASLTSLDAMDRGITDLRGIQYCGNLRELNLGVTLLSRAAATLGVRTNANQIVNIGPLASLTNLQELSIGGNRIVDVSPLSRLRNLVDLDLGDNRISDISSLSNLTELTRLDLSGNQIRDIAALSRLGALTYLHLNNNELINLDSLSGLKNLVYLNLSNNHIVDITPLAELTKLWWLDLSGNEIKNIQGLAKLENIQYLFLSHNMITDISPLGRPGFLLLALDDNRIRNISPLSNAGHITGIVLEDNQITDLAPLVGNLSLETMDRISLHDNPLSLRPGSEALRDIKLLQRRGVIVTYDSCDLPDIPDPGLEAAIRDAIKKPTENIRYDDLTNLEVLKADHRGIVNLEGIQYCGSLTYLNLSNNHISDISLLAGNSKIAEGATVDLRANDLDLQANSTAMLDIKTLQKRGVEVLYDPVLVAPVTTSTLLIPLKDLAGIIDAFRSEGASVASMAARLRLDPALVRVLDEGSLGASLRLLFVRLDESIRTSLLGNDLLSRLDPLIGTGAIMVLAYSAAGADFSPWQIFVDQNGVYHVFFSASSFVELTEGFLDTERLSANEFAAGIICRMPSGVDAGQPFAIWYGKARAQEYR